MNSTKGSKNMEKRKVSSQGQRKTVLSCLILLSVCFIGAAVTNASLSKTISGNAFSTGSTKQPNPKYSVSSSVFPLSAAAGRSLGDSVWQITNQRSLIEKQKELIL